MELLNKFTVIQVYLYPSCSSVIAILRRLFFVFLDPGQALGEYSHLFLKYILVS